MVSAFVWERFDFLMDDSEDKIVHQSRVGLGVRGDLRFAGIVGLKEVGDGLALERWFDVTRG